MIDAANQSCFIDEKTLDPDAIYRKNRGNLFSDSKVDNYFQYELHFSAAKGDGLAEARENMKNMT